MRFAGTKTLGQQTVQVLHRTRELLIKQRVQLSNALRAHLAEFGWIFPQRNAGLDKAIVVSRTRTLPIFPPLFGTFCGAMLSN